MIQSTDKLRESIAQLEHALSFEERIHDDPFFFAGIAKCFESCLEYAWKYFKRRALDEGLDAFSPKESIKLAGKLGIIENVELWLDFMADRNDAVHDYIGVSDEDYLKTIKSFAKEVKKIPLHFCSP